jgi:CBS domain-containing protein
MTLDIQPRLDDLPLRPIVTITPDRSLRSAAEAMRASNISCLVVNTPGQPVSILTERDIAHAVADDVDNDTPVEALASPRPMTVAADTTVVDAATHMLRHGIRHLVVTRAERAIGVVSIRDLLATLVTSVSTDTLVVMVEQAWHESPENWLG